jgi:hypothetical protein
MEFFMKKIKTLHPIIEKMNVSEKAKSFFNKYEFYEIIEDPIATYEGDKEIEEHMKNRWSFKVDLKYCAKDDILDLYHEILKSRREYIKENNIKKKLLFFTWYDSMSGSFYFSIISKKNDEDSTYSELPFDCTLEKVQSIEELVQIYIDDSYKGVIPLSEIKFFEDGEEEEMDKLLEEIEEKYTLPLWVTTL